MVQVVTVVTTSISDDFFCHHLTVQVVTGAEVETKRQAREE